MLRISRIADYGVVLATRLATADALRSVRDLASETGIPQPTTAKILKQLVRSALVRSERGAHGGYRLAREPAAITVAEVITALEGPIGVTECGPAHATTDAGDQCEFSARCDVRDSWQRINTAIYEALDGISLAEMARPPAHLVPLGRRPAATASSDGSDRTRS